MGNFLSSFYLSFFICKTGMRCLPASRVCLLNDCLITLHACRDAPNRPQPGFCSRVTWKKAKPESSSPSPMNSPKSISQNEGDFIQPLLYSLKCTPRLAAQKWRTEEETKVMPKILIFRYPFRWLLIRGEKQFNFVNRKNVFVILPNQKDLRWNHSVLRHKASTNYKQEKNLICC